MFVYAYHVLPFVRFLFSFVECILQVIFLSYYCMDNFSLIISEKNKGNNIAIY